MTPMKWYCSLTLKTISTKVVMRNIALATNAAAAAAPAAPKLVPSCDAVIRIHLRDERWARCVNLRGAEAKVCSLDCAAGTQKRPTISNVLCTRTRQKSNGPAVAFDASGKAVLNYRTRGAIPCCIQLKVGTVLQRISTSFETSSHFASILLCTPHLFATYQEAPTPPKRNSHPATFAHANCPASASKTQKSVVNSCPPRRLASRPAHHQCSPPRNRQNTGVAARQQL